MEQVVGPVPRLRAELGRIRTTLVWLILTDALRMQTLMPVSAYWRLNGGANCGISAAIVGKAPVESECLRILL